MRWRVCVLWISKLIHLLNLMCVLYRWKIIHGTDFSYYNCIFEILIFFCVLWMFFGWPGFISLCCPNGTREFLSKGVFLLPSGRGWQYSWKIILLGSKPTCLFHPCIQRSPVLMSNHITSVQGWKWSGIVRKNLWTTFNIIFHIFTWKRKRNGNSGRETETVISGNKKTK